MLRGIVSPDLKASKMSSDDILFFSMFNQQDYQRLEGDIVLGSVFLHCRY